MPDTAHPAPPAVRLTRVLATGSLLALIALCLAWELWLAPLRPGGSLLAIKALPLLLPLPGLLRYRMYTYRWVTLFMWPYFAEGVMRALNDGGLSALLAMTEVLLTLTLFTACVAHVRLRLASAHNRANAEV